jgi:hypothetical protein
MLLIDLDLLLQTDSISWINYTTILICHSLMTYFHFIKASDAVPRDLLLPTLNDCWLPAGYTSRWRSNLTNNVLHVCYCVALPSPYEVLSGVLQGSVLGPHIVSFFINYLCSVGRNLNGLLFADDNKSFRDMNFPL